MVNKRLVFHFYANEGWDDNIANICHFNCLKYFAHVFNEAIIVISYKDLSDDAIISVKKRFIDAMDDCKSVTFKVANNTSYYEAETFNEEIIKKLNILDGLVFFGHNKGISNVLDDDKSKTAILSWICGLYFWGLNFVDEMECELCTKLASIFYGPYLMWADYISNANHMWYAGTFYWVNVGRLNRQVKNKPVISDREYAEWFPGEVAGAYGLKSHGNKILNNSDLYRNWMYFAKSAALNEVEYEQFLSFKEMAMGFFKEYKYTVLTYNFGNYEIMREIQGKQDDVEYIYVTDDKTLTSNTWTIVYDEELEGLDIYEKVLRVRENMFKYCSTTTCIRIDASIWLIGSLDKFVDDFLMSNSDIGIMVHPERDNVFDEYDKWIELRGCDPKEKENVIAGLKENGCNLEMKGLYELGFMICFKSPYTQWFFWKYSTIIRDIISKYGKVRVDQVVFSAVFNTFSSLYPFPMSHACIQSDVLLSMEHNSPYTCVVHNIPETGCVKGVEKKLYKINA